MYKQYYAGGADEQVGGAVWRRGYVLCVLHPRCDCTFDGGMSVLGCVQLMVVKFSMVT